MKDPLRLQERMLSICGSHGQLSFGELVAATALPVVARAHALHLMWHRRLGVDLNAQLTDGSPVWLAGCGGGR
jgi:hypothetical protein